MIAITIAIMCFDFILTPVERKTGAILAWFLARLYAVRYDLFVTEVSLFELRDLPIQAHEKEKQTQPDNDRDNADDV
jgi:hypothetical protein